MSRGDPKSVHTIVEKGAEAQARKLTIPLFCKSKSVPSKKLSSVIADAERFLSPVFT